MFDFGWSTNLIKKEIDRRLLVNWYSAKSKRKEISVEWALKQIRNQVRFIVPTVLLLELFGL